MGSVVVLDMGLAKGSGQFVSIGGSARTVKKTNAVLPLICIFPFDNEHKFSLKPKRNFSVSLFKSVEAVVYLTHWKEQERDFMISFKFLFEVEYLYL